MFRIGNGYDVHMLTEGRKLVLGGVEIPHNKGVLGHSDGDVLIHAIMDALLGALALGDIGLHFPDSKEEYRGISSLSLLEEVSQMVKKKGYRIENVDSTIALQRPKLRPYIDSMREKIAETLDMNLEQVSIKATTEERLGFTGREEGVKAYAVALLERD
ncbi:2-C-methyl-D-erythritol 2,4-cyclodiphosphate synthase [Fusobacterium necrophorum subsp. funduliforme]|uniref:2-C-methyl-D-erythritol 2,4-cyclodiphosphate synthase n=4 Tax=Fusobacterium necrophorum TaxID=859 RepID=A0AAN3VWA4_9FUSO|nr:2-C-methyl-D-erythritol 2,4-cyclodiphosphate synthase [Fusobacterium necrophorum]EHO16924.1 2-C-methyl-D-erythritol 2,4-cyclodiphosphate synthase [Fusobacterium necrophorum subsp. funduliforme 1_1_36S]AVQ20228.1 2-C-methyl-D-erythritol 2,4-cyclodiphosphate synthase [Fusobacterium necrophorum subsp. funduliforme]AYV93767.1 2-C-methyl-D-erythritol 2,4-cyclodiphosphate synthase [Fusobacterium necrophorum subsp. funduliforme]AYV95934.1 2-C-methyl-D-erythritol 2,4-cyclodiphosphate synthase [Fusob